MSEEDYIRWAKVLEGLQQAVPESEYHTWFGDGVMVPQSFQEGVLTVGVPNASYMEIVGSKYGALLKELIEGEWGFGIVIRYISKR